MISFEQFWQLMYDHGSHNYYKNDSFTCWNELTPDQQQAVYDRIEQKIRIGKFVAYNPAEAIHDNLPRRRVASIGVPTDWNGRQAPEPTDIACYNGHWGMYTLTDIQKFNLQTKHKR